QPLCWSFSCHSHDVVLFSTLSLHDALPILRLSRLGVLWTPCPPPPGPDHHWLSVHQEMHPVVPPLLRGRIPESPQPWCPASVPSSMPWLQVGKDCTD